MYANNQCCLRHGGQQSDWFAVKSGVRQGCIISPLLFLIAIDWVMKRATNQQPRGITWKAFKHLEDEDFADDIALLSHSQKDMQEKTRCVETTARSIGLKISHSKSKVMKINTKSNSDVLIDGKSEENVTDFKYLGSYLTADGNINREISARIAMASTAFYKLNNIWNSNRAPSSACTLGGHLAGEKKCDMCCHDDTCVNQITSQLLQKAPVICPGQCSLSHPEACWNVVTVCGADQFCELKLGRRRNIIGHCRDEDDSRSRCLLSVLKNPCPAAMLTDPSLSVPNDCYIDCCTDNSCVGSHFGGVYSNGVGSAVLPPIFTSTVSTSTVTTVATTMSPYNVYSKLVQECRDHLEPGVCNDLKATQDLCKENGSGLHVDLCPETCGVCQAIKEANCHDTVLDGECAQLMAEKDICSGALARYTCPATCGLCDILIEEKLVAILAAKSTKPPTQPPTTQPPTQPPSTQSPTQPQTTQSTTPPPTTQPPTQPPTTQPPKQPLTTQSTTPPPTTQPPTELPTIQPPIITPSKLMANH
ncbi:hypothetical protein ElyMa_002753400 [Elysia marginata]|uniref:Reverse transcriptase domain-containing protein n=1 Tax=Elysia marginata TaxID=1093978 RepID=A0AAV4HL09_9GAST|nr:hypothetical protein ElyMa_002753400 [Elysia marginata]